MCIQALRSHGAGELARVARRGSAPGPPHTFFELKALFMLSCAPEKKKARRFVFITADSIIVLNPFLFHHCSFQVSMVARSFFNCDRETEYFLGINCAPPVHVPLKPGLEKAEGHFALIAWQHQPKLYEVYR